MTYKQSLDNGLGLNLNGVSSDVAIHASANTTTVAGVTSFVSATGALTLTVGSTNYSIDLTGVTAQNSAITTAIVSALQTASVGTSVALFQYRIQDTTIHLNENLKFLQLVHHFKFNLQGKMRRQLFH